MRAQSLDDLGTFGNRQVSENANLQSIQRGRNLYEGVIVVGLVGVETQVTAWVWVGSEKNLL